VTYFAKQNKKMLSGIYFVTYDGDRYSRCSVINIKFSQKENEYIIDIYDYHLQGTVWHETDCLNPLIVDEVFFGPKERKIHIIAESINGKMCGFFEFIKGKDESFFNVMEIYDAIQGRVD